MSAQPLPVDPLLLDKKIDLVDFGDVALFMFKDDNLYQLSIPEERKNASPRDHYLAVARDGHKPSPVTPANVGAADDARAAFPLVMDHLWRQGLDFSVLDVGAFIGDFSIKCANVARTFGKGMRAYAFDPTPAGALIPYNAALNGLADRVVHERLAVLDYDGYAVFSVTPGYSDAPFALAKGYAKGKHQFNWLHLAKHLARTSYKGAYLGKFARYLRRREPTNLIVPSASLASWLEKNGVAGHLLVKVDVEGLDQMIVEQLLALEGRHVVTCVEFTPNAYPAPEAAAQFLGKLARGHHVFDLWYSPNPCRCAPVAEDRVLDFVREVRDTRIFGYTDLLLVPKTLPGADVLARRLAGLRRLPEEYVL